MAAYTRREFVHRGLGFVSMGATAPAFLARSVWAMDDPLDAPLTQSKPGMPDDRVLVVLQLAGGNDGLNTVVPFRNDDYYRARPKLAIPRDKVHRINGDLGFHPEAEGLKQLYDQGHMAIVQGVGYPNPNRSHFTSTQIWDTADPKERTHTGWMGRYFDAQCAGAEPPDPKMGIAITKEAPESLIGATFHPVAFTSPEQLRWKYDSTNKTGRSIYEQINGVSDDVTSPNGITNINGNGAHTPNETQVSTLDYVRRAALSAQVDVQRIRKAAALDGKNYKYQLQTDLAMVARMIAAGIQTKIYYVSLSGFDTHSGQEGRHGALLSQLSSGLTTFFDELKAFRIEERVLLMTFSEFGRRVAQNASGGTDHGQAAPLFMAGAAIKGGIYGRHPSLRSRDLERGDVRFNTDFRSVYATVLHDWFGADPNTILGGTFKTLNMIQPKSSHKFNTPTLKFP